MGDDRRDDDARHDDGGFRRPLARDRLSRRLADPVFVVDADAWHLAVGTVAVNHIASRKVEAFYWTAILFSNTLGTALGDWLAGSGPGYEGGALVFAALLLAIAAAYFFTTISHTLLFWAAFILARPLGARLGDLLTKPVASGGLNLSRIESSLTIAVFIVGCILVLPQRAVRHPGEA